MGATQAKRHQEEWAAYLKVPVEYTNSIGMKFRLIPPAEFLMGCTPDEVQKLSALPIKGFGDTRAINSSQSSVPQHRVVLTQPFYLGIHEVTQKQYTQVMNENPSFCGPMGRQNYPWAGQKKTPVIDQYLVYDIDRGDGRIETLTPAEFRKLLPEKERGLGDDDNHNATPLIPSSCDAGTDPNPSMRASKTWFVTKRSCPRWTALRLKTQIHRKGFVSMVCR